MLLDIGLNAIIDPAQLERAYDAEVTKAAEQYRSQHPGCAWASCWAAVQVQRTQRTDLFQQALAHIPTRAQPYKIRWEPSGPHESRGEAGKFRLYAGFWGDWRLHCLLGVGPYFDEQDLGLLLGRGQAVIAGKLHPAKLPPGCSAELRAAYATEEALHTQGQQEAIASLNVLIGFKAFA